MTPLSIDQLLDQARQIDTGVIRRLALDVKQLGIKLDKAIRDERQIQRLTELRTEIARLESIHTPRPGRVSRGNDQAQAAQGYDPATVRAWAKDHWEGAVSPKGRFLPDDLVAAWREAQ